MNSSLEIPCLKREIHKKFKTIIDGRSAIIISHRFSTVIMADHIYVLEQGRAVNSPLPLRDPPTPPKQKGGIAGPLN
jgi:ABC-type branched-subunit amino acid transport system ATPase component